MEVEKRRCKKKVNFSTETIYVSFFYVLIGNLSKGVFVFPLSSKCIFVVFFCYVQCVCVYLRTEGLKWLVVEVGAVEVEMEEVVVGTGPHLPYTSIILQGTHTSLLLSLLFIIKYKYVHIYV